MLDLDLLCGYGLRDEDGNHAPALTQALATAALADPATYDVLSRSLPRMEFPAGTVRRALWDGARKVFGKDLELSPQEVGDCVGVSAGNAVQNCQVQAMLAGERATYSRIFSPYHWGMGRLAADCGNNACGLQDGSMGSWQARALVKYGCLSLDAKNAQGETLPPYSGSAARKWGNRPGPSPAWQEAGRLHPVKAATPVRTKDELATAIFSGNPVTVASNQGFTFAQSAAGFHERSGVWNHQMEVEHLDLGGDGIPAHAGICNQWGDAFGEVVDFRTGEKWPRGRLRVRLEVLLAMLAQNDSFAYTGVAGWYVPDPAHTNFRPF